MKTLPGFLGVGVQEELPEDEKVDGGRKKKPKRTTRRSSW
jgi:hypothetical protein